MSYTQMVVCVLLFVYLFIIITQQIVIHILNEKVHENDMYMSMIKNENDNLIAVIEVCNEKINQLEKRIK